ncbi:MAG TPA: glycosyltransferase family 4 protein [Longilinea sp.]|nr:glycosyltransferase family 4 protein [Longilinea sp.]
MNQPKIRVAILYDQPLDLGGVETHLESIFRCADSTRYVFTIIAPEAPAFANQIKNGEIRFIPFDGWWPLRWQNYRRLSQIIKSEGIDLLHTHSATAAILGRSVARKQRLPVVATVHLPVTQYHGTLQTARAKTGRFIFTQLDRLLNFAATDQIIFVSQNDQSSCIQSGLVPAAKTEVIPNGIDLSPYRVQKEKASLRHQFNAPLDAAILTYVGRLDNQKGIDVLLNAFSRLPELKTPCILWVIGDGPLRGILEKTFSARNPDKQVIFWGYRKPIADFLFASDLFILPSLYEAMPITLLEALAAGLPCIATDVGDNNLLIKPGVNGLIVPVNDAQALQQAIHSLMGDPILRERMKGNNLQKINNFDEQFMVERLQIIYNRLVTEKPRKNP